MGAWPASFQQRTFCLEAVHFRRIGRTSRAGLVLALRADPSGMRRTLFSTVVAGSCALAGAVPSTASAQPRLLGGVGSIVSGTTEQVTSTLDQVLGGVEGVLSDDALGDVLVTVTNPVSVPGAAPVAPGVPGAPGAPGTPGSSGSGEGSQTTLVRGVPVGSTVTIPSGGADDRHAPAATVKVVSRLSQVARTRRLRLEVRSDEPGVVAIAATIRPGAKRRGVAKGVKHKRSVIHVPTLMLAFHRAGTVTVDLRLRAADAALLGRSKNGRMSVGLLTADVARNQASERLKRHLRR